MISLILGGARSGKSRYAEQLALASNKPLLYVATATASDAEMSARIAHHQVARTQQTAHSQQPWRLCESPLALIQTLRSEGAQPQCILVDCLTLWLNNQLFHCPQQDFTQLFNALITTAQTVQADIIFVANEVGLGVIPMGEISRRFVDEAGRLNQQVAAIADQVFFIAAGLPLCLKAATVESPQ
jgi:adenosylcobinamide kinase / adenosylcobinamide-phosphate guanylyltransferase